MHQSRREVAYHEAGHAVMCWRLGFHVWEIVLDDGPGRAGVCRWEPPPCADERKLAEQMILVHVAGRAAQRRLLGREPDRPMLSDAQKSMALARTLTRTERDARHLVVTLYNRACEIVAGANCWPAVAAVAELLLHLGRLDGKPARVAARFALGV